MGNYEKLINRLSPTIRKISHRLNGHFTYFNDDDLCQEALIHLWALSQEGRLNDKTDSYILQGCYFHLKNYIRTSMDKACLTSLETPIDDDGTMLAEAVASRNSFESDQLEESTLYEVIQKGGLSEREIAIIEMFTEGFTAREIGKRFGISHVAVVKLRQKIRKKCQVLKKEFGNSYQN